MHDYSSYDDKKLQSDIKYLSYNLIDKENKPYIQVKYKNELKEYMKEKFGNFLIHVSLSDTKKYSIASVIIEKT